MPRKQTVKASCSLRSRTSRSALHHQRSATRCPPEPLRSRAAADDDNPLPNGAGPQPRWRI